jgi:uncharacterized protein
MPASNKAIFIFAHGAGAGMNSEFMTNIAELVACQTIEVIRFDFPYMKLINELGKRRPPDRMPKLIQAFQSELNILLNDSRYLEHSIFIGGKSMGGRVASHIATNENLDSRVKGLICLGFPFHPPKSPDKYRGDHLVQFELATLILQGERDTFGSKAEVLKYPLSTAIECQFLTDGDHSFKPRKRSAVSCRKNLETSALLISQFIQRHSSQ